MKKSAFLLLGAGILGLTACNVDLSGIVPRASLGMEVLSPKGETFYVLDGQAQIPVSANLSSDAPSLSVGLEVTDENGVLAGALNPSEATLKGNLAYSGIFSPSNTAPGEYTLYLEARAEGQVVRKAFTYVLKIPSPLSVTPETTQLVLSPGMYQTVNVNVTGEPGEGVELSVKANGQTPYWAVFAQDALTLDAQGQGTGVLQIAATDPGTYSLVIAATSKTMGRSAQAVIAVTVGASSAQ